MENVLDLSYEASPQMLEREVSNGFSWLRSSNNPEASIIQITDAASRELKIFSDLILDSSRTREDLSLAEFHVPELTKIMQKVRKKIKSES